MTASTTSLTVAPRADFTALTSSSDSEVETYHRWGVSAVLNAGGRRAEGQRRAHRAGAPAAAPTARKPLSVRASSAGTPSEGAHDGDERLTEQLQVPTGRRRAATGWTGGGGRGRVGPGVEHVHQQLGRLDPVGHAVVDLGHEADVAVLEPLDDPDLPERRGGGRAGGWRSGR